MMRVPNLLGYSILFSLALTVVAAEPADEFPGPMSPEESLKAIKVLPGLKVELVAAEPLIEDPVAFDWAPDGRLWVAEMRDYPNGLTWNKPDDPRGVPGGRIRLLTDTDNDGRYDKSDIFLDNVPFPNGVKAWRSGVLVVAVPKIFYAEDTNGDGVADKQETLFEGFGEGNQQHRANGLRWGIDGWLYVANGDSGGKIKSHKTGQELSISGRDLRIRPDDGAMETQSGQSQFGRCCDDWGNWFGNNNANPLWHYVLDDHYLRRNPHFTPPAVRRDVPEMRGAAPVFPISKTLTRFNDFHTANRFTSACSPEIYRDEVLNSVLGSSLETQPTLGTHLFICEPVHNLVHHEVMTSEGLIFRSQRATNEQQSEFFASADNWSRPVMIRTAPDGSLWIADMYRLVIEHPEWIPLTWQRKLDLRAGADRGRIYRVSLANETRKPFPKLDHLDTPGLLVKLHEANGWQRDTVQQLLLWKKDELAVPLLEQIVEDAPQAATRLQALATLDGMQKLRPEVVKQAAHDKHPGVRRFAVRTLESLFNNNLDLVGILPELAKDPDAFVRQQVAYTVGELKSDPLVRIRPREERNTLDYVARGNDALKTLALQDADNPYIFAALLSSVHAGNIDSAVLGLIKRKPLPIEQLASLLRISTRFESPGTTVRLVDRISREALEASKPSLETKLDVAAHLLEAVSASGKIDELLNANVKRRFEQVVEQARSVLVESNDPLPTRVAAVKLLGVQPSPDSSDAELLVKLLDARNSPELQTTAASAIAARFPGTAASQLLAGWRGHSPALRTQILDLFATRPAWTGELLAMVEKGDILISQIDARRRQLWVNHTDEAIRERAKKLFLSETPSSRAQVVEQLQSVLQLEGISTHGKTAFAKKCANCHRLEETGQNVGPDLLALTDKSPRSLLTAILDPNKAVEDKFLDYIATTADGRQFTGMLLNETTTSLTLAGQDGKQVALNRADLEMLQSTGKSVMPEGLEKDLSPQELADVIAYVRSVSLPPKSFPGNTPAPAQVRDDGSIRLLAMNAKIYGDTIIFEEKYRNLGFWRSRSDHAVWTMNVPKAGKYRVTIDYACEDASAGSRFVVAVGDQSVSGVAEGTGSWDNYRSRPIGIITLPQGPADLVMRSDGKIASALMDLRQIVLSPQ